MPYLLTSPLATVSGTESESLHMYVIGADTGCVPALSSVCKQSNHVAHTVARSSGRTLARKICMEHDTNNAGLVAYFSLGCTHCRSDYAKHI